MKIISPMTMRQRLLATLRGEPHDQIPFSLYEGILPVDEVRELLGEGNYGRIVWATIYKFDTPHCRIDQEPIEHKGLSGMRFTLHTPVGNLTQEVLIDPVYGSWATHKHYIQDMADYDIMDAYLDDIKVICDTDSYLEKVQKVGDEGVVYMGMPRTPWQQLWVEWVSIEELSWHFTDDEDRMMHTVSKLSRVWQDIYPIISEIKPEIVNVGDNITAPTIGPEKFARFCLPKYQELSAYVAEYNGSVLCHMDGDLRPLWPLIAQSGLTGLDSFSPPPDNDTSVADALEQWPGMSFWMNFPSSVHLSPEDEIRLKMREILLQGGNSGRLAIQISENVPLSIWRFSLPIIVDELLRYGTPGQFC